MEIKKSAKKMSEERIKLLEKRVRIATKALKAARSKASGRSIGYEIGVIVDNALKEIRKRN